jgi:hypothetical protein
VIVNKDGVVRFTTNSGPVTTQLVANPPSIPKDNCWHFFEVHQKLSSDPAKAVNRLRIDNQEIPTVNAANFPANATGPYRRLKAGIVNRFGVSDQVRLYEDMVGLGYGGPLSTLGCQGVNDNYPG